MDKREANARYYAAHRDRIILRESELRPSTILELIDCLEDQELHAHDKRVERLERLFVELTGIEPEQFRSAEGGAMASGTPPVQPAQVSVDEVVCAPVLAGPPS
ncbi:MAG: hypothetical protein J0I99_15850 [Devosia sp.]|uniref:hypothetical protein n=1 Tax=Devosia sp. TaxID=1871048 RepID=UPI001AC51193|nr:hypothetical protein [Devosia sp.]MBN9310336.1 hypothetical protein [Devosia sp.]MBN9317216.1 hypothetical protein [Devosia sp.]